MHYIENREVRIVRGLPVVFLSGDSMPSDVVVCPRCCGRGHHVNPSVDGDGFTMDEWNELDIDFQESYISGEYDVTCEVCDGFRITATIATDRLNADQWEVLHEHERNEADMADTMDIQRAEIAMGA